MNREFTGVDSPSVWQFLHILYERLMPECVVDGVFAIIPKVTTTASAHCHTVTKLYCVKENVVQPAWNEGHILSIKLHHDLTASSSKVMIYRMVKKHVILLMGILFIMRLILLKVSNFSGVRMSGM